MLPKGLPSPSRSFKIYNYITGYTEKKNLSSFSNRATKSLSFDKKKKTVELYNQLRVVKFPYVKRKWNSKNEKLLGANGEKEEEIQSIIGKNKSSCVSYDKKEIGNTIAKVPVGVTVV